MLLPATVALYCIRLFQMVTGMLYYYCRRLATHYIFSPCRSLLGVDHLIVFETNRTISHVHLPHLPAGHSVTRRCSRLRLHEIVSQFSSRSDLHVSSQSFLEQCLRQKISERLGFEPSTLGAVCRQISPLDHDAPPRIVC